LRPTSIASGHRKDFRRVGAKRRVCPDRVAGVSALSRRKHKSGSQQKKASEVVVEPSASESGNHNDKKEDSTKWWRSSHFIFNSIIAISAFASFWVIFFQLMVMRRALIVDQRAWISVSVVGWAPIGENMPLGVTLHVTNTGKTPAKRVAQQIVIEKIDSQNSPTFAYDRPHVASVAGIMVPNTPRDIAAVMLTKEKPAILDPPLMTKADIDEINSGKVYLAVFGKFSYWDIHDVIHWVSFCFWHSPTSGNYSAKKCAAYNDIDNN
jgi:hypothetical protein